MGAGASSESESESGSVEQKIVKEMGKLTMSGKREEEEEKGDENREKRNEMIHKYVNVLEHFSENNPVMFKNIRDNLRILMHKRKFRKNEKGKTVSPTTTTRKIINDLCNEILPYVKRECANDNKVLTVFLQDFSDRRNKEDPTNNGFGVGFFIFYLACLCNTKLTSIKVHRGNTTEPFDESEKMVLSLVYLLRLTGIESIVVDNEEIWKFLSTDEVTEYQKRFNVDFLLRLLFCCCSIIVERNHLQTMEFDNDSMTINITTTF